MVVLVVDDEPVVQHLMQSLIGEEDVRVVSATSIRQAHARVATDGPVDVALVDKNLPDGSGLELVAELKGVDPDIEILVITAYASIDSAITAIQLDVFDYVVKPFRHVDLLKRKVKSACDKVKLKRERREAIAKLVQSEERYRALLEGCAQAVLIFDEEQQRVQDANTLSQELYGYTRDLLLDREVRELRRDGGGGRWTARASDGREFPVEVSQTHVELRGRPTVIEVARRLAQRNS